MSQITIKDASGSNQTAALVTNTGFTTTTNSLPVVPALYYPVSTNNSSIIQLAAGASFVGVIETILELQAAQVQITCDQPYTVTVNQYIDAAGTKLVSSESRSFVAGDPFNDNITLPGNYFNIVVKNDGQVATTTFRLDTTFGIMDTQPRMLSKYGGFPVSVNDIKGQKLWRSTFAKAVAAGVDTDYFRIIKQAAGMTVSQSGGNLLITSGVTLNEETILRSKEEFDENWITKVQTTLSQRIANNNFVVEMVDVIGDDLAATASSATSLAVTIPNNPFTSANVGQSVYIGGFDGALLGSVGGRYPIASVSGNVVTFTVAGALVASGTCCIWGWNYQQLIYNGTTATQATWDCQRKGYASGVTTATINTTASPGHLAIMGVEDGGAYLSDQLVASSTAVQQTLRATRVVSIPDETVRLYLQFRVLNGSTAPASTTTWTVGMVSIEEYVPIQTAVTKVKSMSYEAPIPVTLPSGTSIAGTQANQSTSVPNPVLTSVYGVSANPTTGTTARQHYLLGTLIGAAIVKPYSIPESDWRYTGTLTTNTAVAARAAGAAGIKNYVTGIQVQNTSATATTFLLVDGATTIWQVSLPASMTLPIDFTFPTPLAGTAATAMNVNCGTTGANVITNVQGYFAP